MSTLIAPHGNAALKPLLLPADERDEARRRARGLKKLRLSSREVSDLFMFAMGAYSPLAGFMGAADWRGACLDMRLENGLFWPFPITLSCAADFAVAVGEDVALTDETGEILGVLTVAETYAIDRDLECREVYRTTDEAHPGVAKVMAQGPVNLAGPVSVFSEGHFPETYRGLYLRPAETRALFAAKGWSTVAAFQTRNPMHRSHEFLAKVAIEVCDGILIHQVLGALKQGDIPADVRVRAIDWLVANHFAEGRVIQAGYPIEMRYAGPREALLHALFRQNFGCSHLVVGRDHAGLGGYYGPYDAHRIFDEIGEDDLAIRPLKIDDTFHCFDCRGMATGNVCFDAEEPPGEDERYRMVAAVATGDAAGPPCPNGDAGKLRISGTRLREMFAGRETIPPEYSRDGVVAILQAFYDGAP
ncbi:MAG: sulfate adenylyltransferase [Defluviicoccus sp.]|nr:sulfate adenylyltransferase [Defluviicoccus sp.]MDE0384871.1 sulfate adenylyltransferase [Defluviicoccus sp.]